MKYLLPLILVCALLCGCRRTVSSQSPAVPTAPPAAEGVAAPPEDAGGSLRRIPLNLSQVQGFRVSGGNLLLFSGSGSTTLTLLDLQSLQTLGSRMLEFVLTPEEVVFHRDGSLSFYDPAAGETLLLDSRLMVLSRIPAPGGLTGSPILSEDAATLFYCTASQLRALDRASGIHRCLTEMAFDSQTLAAVHKNGSLIQCRIRDQGQVQTLFLSGSDGSILHRSPGEVTLTLREDNYYAAVFAGAYPIPLLGTDPRKAEILTPGDIASPITFLPEMNAAVSPVLQEDGSTVLELCSLTTRKVIHRLPWDDASLPLSIAAAAPDALVILPRQDQPQLLLWNLTALPEQDSESRSWQAFPYTQEESPGSLDRCREKADALEERFHLRILLGNEAVSQAPPDRQFVPEHLVPVLQRELALLEQRLSVFPEELLRQTTARFSRVTLCLVRSLEGGPAHPEAPPGMHFFSGQEAYLVLPTGDSGQGLYHQLYHLMDIHILCSSKGLDGWDRLNPGGFRYDYDYGTNALRDSGVYLFEEGRAFADTFSMSYPKEDRARILEYAMLPGNRELFRPPAMAEKLRTLCSAIRDAYNLDSPTAFLWEQYLP